MEGGDSSPLPPDGEALNDDPFTESLGEPVKEQESNSNDGGYGKVRLMLKIVRAIPAIGKEIVKETHRLPPPLN